MKDKILFPYDKIRAEQDDLIKNIIEIISNKKNAIVHAPTGLGKTVASLSPAISYIKKYNKEIDETIKNQEDLLKNEINEKSKKQIKKNIEQEDSDEDLPNKKTIFFLTSRHTQHIIAVETLKAIKNKFKSKLDDNIVVSDIIGKRWMCLVPGIMDLYSGEFAEYCKKMREDKKCEFYVNTKKNSQLTPLAKKNIEELNAIGPNHTDYVIEYCKKDRLCAYEVSCSIAKEADVIIADYYYIFHPLIRQSFFGRIDKNLDDCIIIIDEGHNLPSRIRNILTVKLTNYVLKQAIKEAKKNHYVDIIPQLSKIQSALIDLSMDLKVNSRNSEKIVKKNEFNKLLFDTIKPDEIEEKYDELLANLEFIADAIREKQKKSFIGGIANFLAAWQGPDIGYARIMSIHKGRQFPIIELSYRCLDPSLETQKIVNESHSTILMSGTLTPTSMYRDLLGFDRSKTKELNFPSPFPKENRLTMIVPKTTTKYTQRSPDQFKEIAKVLSNITNNVPGNSAIFFPSYYLREQINNYFQRLSKKSIFVEEQMMTKKNKQDMLERFKQYQNSGAVLLGNSFGSFGEGVDLPGDLLKCVIVVGLPLQKPSLETNELISYYDDKFGKGWDYGYIFPSFNKVLQNAGRCIRSEKDKGIIVFLDYRYCFPNYKRCFPEEYHIEVVENYEERVKGFFGVLG